MKYGKIFLILIFIGSLLTISAAYASDNQTNDLVSIENNLTDNNFDKTPNNSNFTELSNLIKNSAENTTLSLDKDYTYDSSNSEGILINKTLTIDGNGHIINGANKSRIFQISNTHITLKNILFINGFVNDNGGAIYLKNSTAEIFNCTFNYNHGNIAGGAIYTLKSNITILNSIFSYNNGSDIYVSGGALSSFESNINIFNSNFYYNSADAGGAIFAEESTIEINNSEFAHNTANYYGGCLLSDTYYLKINSTLFYDNKAGLRGGAIHSTSKKEKYPILEVNNSELFNNYAKYGAVISTSNLGYNAIYNSQIYSNNATYGAVIARTSMNTIEIRNSSCYNNKGINGSIIYAPSNGNITLKDSKFTNNTGDYGCLIYSIQGRFSLNLLNCNTTVNNCSIIDNYAKDSLIYNFYGNVILNNSSFVYKNNQYPFFVIKKMMTGNVDYENNYWGCENPDFTKLIYINATSQNLNSSIPLNNYDDDCSSTVIQIDENHTVSSFRRDSSIEIPIFIFEDGDLRHEKYDKSRFLHMLISHDGWIIGNGGLDSPYLNEKMESIAKMMIKNNEISERYLELIFSLKSFNDNRGHFIIKSPDGRYGIVNYFNGIKTIEIGVLKSGEYIVCPNNYALHKKGNVSDLPVSTYYEASRYLLGIDLYGTYRTTIQTFEYVKETVDNQIITYVDSYLSNDNGHLVNISGSERYFNDIYSNGKYILGEGIPIIMDGMYLNRFILDAVEIPLIKTKINVKNMQITYNKGKYLTATLTDLKGNAIKKANLVISLNGKTYKKTTDNKGQVKLLIKLAPKTYKASISFAGNNKYMKSSASAKIVVKKAKVKLNANKKHLKQKRKQKNTQLC